ncbi:MAG: insulinase family protein [Planctomycetota bacterium]|nr:MAG: insulinase family protein [Planctomycetota bacterium]
MIFATSLSRISLLLPLLVLGGALDLAGEERRLAERLPPGGESLPSDPEFHWGQLPNGLRYVLRQHAEPAEQISLRLLVHVGSLEESEAEQGLAHYLEHLAFMGSDNFPDNSFVSVMQQAGVSHGSHSNAHTGFDETVYKLDLRTDNPELLGLGSRWMSDVMHALHLRESEIDSERGVILAEMRDRDTPSFRAAQTHFTARYPGSILSTRWPIGLEETVRATTPELMREFWQRWYRPDNAVLSVVGDAPLEELRALVHTAFAEVPAAAGSLPSKPVRAAVQVVSEPVVSIHREDEVGATVLRLYVVSEGQQPPPGLERWRDEVHASLGATVLSRRLADLAEDPTGPILGGSVGQWWWHGMLHGAASVQVRESAVAKAVELVHTELRRFLAHGLSAEELELALAEYTGRARSAVATAGSRSSSQLAVSAYQAIKNDENLLSPEQQLLLIEDIAAAVDPEQVMAAFRAAFEPGESRRTIEITTALEVDAVAVLAAFTRAEAAEVEPLLASDLPPWPYALAPADGGGALLAEQDLPDGGTLISWRYDNGLVAHVLPRQQRPGELLVQLRLARQPGSADSAIRRLASRSFLARGTVQLRASEIRRHLARQASVRMSVNVGDDAIVFQGSSVAEELPMWLSYASGLIGDPGWRDERIEEALVSWLTALRANRNDLAAQVDLRWNHLTTGRGPDRAEPTLEEVEALELAELRRWLEPLLRSGALELAIVGDLGELELEELNRLIAGTLGALPEREPVRQYAQLAETMQEAAAMQAGEQRFTVSGSTPRAQIMIAWPGVDMRDIGSVRRMGQLAGALRVRLRQELRSAMGEAYSPFAVNRSSDLWRDHGYIQAVVSVAPELADAARDAVLRAAAGLREDGLSADIFNEVQRPALSNLPTWRNDNRYWLGQVISRAWSQPQRLQWSADMVEDFAAISIEELNALAERVFAAEPSILIGVSNPE